MHIEAAVEAFLFNFAARGADERREPLIVVQNGEGGIAGKFADAVRRVRQGVEQGRALADCMLTDPAFPRLLTEMTGVGERSGNLEQTLTVIGDYFDNEVSVTTQRLLSLLEPAITIALAVITVVLLLAVYLPMFTMYGSLI